MPDVSLSEAWKEACTVAPSGVVQLHTLEFRHPNFRDDNNVPVALRVVLDHVNLDARLENDAPMNAGEMVTFIPLSFALELPNVESVAAPELKLMMDNVSRDIEDYLAKSTASPHPVQVTYREYLSTDLTGPQNNPPMTFTLKNPEADDMQVTATATTTDVGNRQFPNQDYTTERFPGLRPT
jgi:hypothetical protein